MPEQKTGRPRENPEAAKQQYSTKIDPQIIKYLRASGNAAATLEALIRRSKSFKLWDKNQCK